MEEKENRGSESAGSRFDEELMLPGGTWWRTREPGGAC
jgi:hypothetical protein